MADLTQYGTADQDGSAYDVGRPECFVCRELFTEATDGLLQEEDRSFFNLHLAACADCTERFTDAQRGAAWLELLNAPRPEPSNQLFARILAATNDFSQIQNLHPNASGEPTQPLRLLHHSQMGTVLAFLPRGPRLTRLMLDPRLAMTAAMAFFSVAVTLSMSGVRVDQLHAANLNPAGLKRTYFQATASAARHYEGLRVVHVLESRAEDLRDTLIQDTLSDTQHDNFSDHQSDGRQRRSQQTPSKPYQTRQSPGLRSPGEPHPTKKPAEPQGNVRNLGPEAELSPLPRHLFVCLEIGRFMQSGKLGDLV